MCRGRVANARGMFACLLASLLLALLSVPLRAQTAPESHAGRGFGPAYDAAHETILIGTIQQVATRHEAGSPAGMHLLVLGPQGVVDVHVGPFLSSEAKDALHTGTPVQIVGAAVQMRDKQYFLARELTVGALTITIRSARGFLVHPHGERNVKARTAPQAEANGGAR